MKNKEEIGVGDTNQEELYKNVIELWGVDSQIIVAIEELSELQKELTKALRSGYSIDGMAEEIADVKIMIDQLEIIFKIDEDIEFWKEHKLQRLNKRYKQALELNKAIKHIEDKEEM